MASFVKMMGRAPKQKNWNLCAKNTSKKYVASKKHNFVSFLLKLWYNCLRGWPANRNLFSAANYNSNKNAGRVVCVDMNDL
jgi:hypothetical protein